MAKSGDIFARASAILGYDVEDLTFTQLIEELVDEIERYEFNQSDRRTRNGQLFAEYDKGIVSYRTFFRRLKKGMSPEEAATKPPSPTRPYDNKK
jgi:hypothetical protein